jgi:hypothetical protein
MAKEERQHDEPCRLAVEMKMKIDSLEEDKKDQWEYMTNLTKSIAPLSEKITSSITELQEKYINRLPLWATFLITGLCSIVTGFIVAHFTRSSL